MKLREHPQDSTYLQFVCDLPLQFAKTAVTLVFTTKYVTNVIWCKIKMNIISTLPPKIKKILSKLLDNNWETNTVLKSYFCLILKKWKKEENVCSLTRKEIVYKHSMRKAKET